MIRSLKSLLLIFFSLSLLVSCSGGGSSSSGRSSNNNSNQPPNTSLSDQAENSFLTQGIQITTSKESINFGSLSPDRLQTQNFTLSNNSGRTLTFILQLTAPNGNFNFLADDGSSFAYRQVQLESGRVFELRVQFKEQNLGSYHGVVNITAQNINGQIKMPLQAVISGSPNLKIISSRYFCSDPSAPEISHLDFLRVPSGSLKKLTFKICNVGGNSLTILRPIVTQGVNYQSSSLNDDYEMPYQWNILDQIAREAREFFPYYNFPILEEKPEFNMVNYSRPIPDATQFFSVVPNLAPNQVFPTSGVTIASGSFVSFDVTFRPNISFEIVENQLALPISLTAKIEADTSLGIVELDLAGTTGGREPKLELNYQVGDGELIPINLESKNPAINFPEAPIYDWYFEGNSKIKLWIKNAGTGTKSLKVWIDDINRGYFVIGQQDPEKTLPITLRAGEQTFIPLIYAPTPESRTAKSTKDLGQITLHQNGTDGRSYRIGLIGKQVDREILSLKQGVKPLKRNYPEGQAINFCAFKMDAPIGAIENKRYFYINNRSSRFLLRSRISTTNASGANGNVVNQINIIPSHRQIDVNPGSQLDFHLQFDIVGQIEDRKEFFGELTVRNFFLDGNREEEHSTYRIPYRGYVSETGECEGVLSVPDGPVVLSFYRGNLILFNSPIKQPSRTPPASKFEVKADINKQYSSIVARPIELGTKDTPIHKQLSVFSHKSSTFNDCPAIPHLPYVTELEPGSYLGPGHDCGELVGTGSVRLDDASIALMKSDGLEDITYTEDGVEKRGKVGYYKFLKYNVDTCEVEFEGKFSTWFMPEGYTVGSWWQEMQSGPQGTTGDINYYHQYTKPFQFGSYINFNTPINLPGCTHAVGTIEDPDSLQACWNAFREAPKVDLSRVSGMVEQRSAFLFSSEGGCYPQDAPEVLDETSGIDRSLVCERAPNQGGSTYSNPDTWVGYGKMELDANGRYDLTIRNLDVETFLIQHSKQILFSAHGAEHIYSKMYLTLTTKVIGNDEEGEDPYEYVAVGSRRHFDIGDLQLFSEDSAVDAFWTNPKELNSQLAVGENGAYDDIDCEPGVLDCRGNYYISQDGNRLMLKGQAMDLDQNGRFILVAAAAFEGEDSMAPSFIRSDSSTGKGALTYLTFNGCIRELPRDENGNILDYEEPVSCYEPKLDDGVWEEPDGDGRPMIDIYQSLGLLTPEQAHPLAENLGLSPAYIDFPIYPVDRDRYTNFFEGGSQFKYHSDAIGKTVCGYGL